MSNQVLVEVEAAEDSKVPYVLEREFAEHLRGKQKYPVAIVREVSEEEFREYVEANKWFTDELNRYYDEKPQKVSKKELVLVEIKITENIKGRLVLEREFAELLKRKQKYPVTILREATEEELQKYVAIEAWLYHEALHHYDREGGETSEQKAEPVPAPTVQPRVVAAPLASFAIEADRLKLKIRELLEEYLPQAELEHVVRHEVEEFVYRTIFREFRIELDELASELTAEVFKKKLEEMAGDLIKNEIKQLLKNTAEKDILFIRQIVDKEYEKVAKELAKKVVEERADELRNMVEETVAKATKDCFAELVAERMKTLISTLERLEKKADALEQRLMRAEQQTTGTW